jgi:hypothetical protein
VYHQSCSVNFRTRREIPFKYRQRHDETNKTKSGRPENEILAEAFAKVCSYVEENEDEQHTITDLTSLMNQYLEHTKENAYNPRYLKPKLREYFDESIFISEKHGQKDIVVLRKSLSSIIRKHYEYQHNAVDETEKMRIIETAAKLIKTDIKLKTIGLGNKECHPASTDLELEESMKYLPSSLKLLCSKIFFAYGELKIAAIGKSIIQACIPRVIITLIQLGLPFFVYTHFRSQFHFDVLSHLGFGSSYQEIRKFMRNASFATDGHDTLQYLQSINLYFGKLL